MRQFFKFFFASMLGFIVGSVVLFFLLILMIAGVVSTMSGPKTMAIHGPHVLKINLQQPLTERTPNNPFRNFRAGEIKSQMQPGVYDIIEDLDKAANDKNIKGIYLNITDIDGGISSVEEIRNAILKFKKSKKFVIAYSEYYSNKGYYLASAADKVYLNPEGELDFRGYATQLMFLKGMLEKVGVEPQIIRHGKFKSAVEPLTEEKMSDANREQMKALIDDLWKHTLAGIGKSRNKTYDELELMADSLLIESPADAVKYGLIDGTKYEDEIMKMLTEKSETKDDKVDFVSLEKYNNVPSGKKFHAQKIALIFATGSIGSGKGDDESIGSETTADAIRKAREDKNVKAIVLRVNSPGGSALASDVIWREVTLAKKEKPVVVSMGDLAASGGYYISCAADKIYAQPNTITGSIGVFGVIFNAQKMLNEKLGLTFDTYKTGEYGDMGLPTRALTPGERRKIQNSVENVYDQFTKKVGDGRGIAQANVDSIGQGRVWSGEDALQIKLVDELGGINDAIAAAAKLAKITEYRVSQLPVQKEPFVELLEGGADDVKQSMINSELGANAKYYKSLKDIFKMQGIQVRLPYDITIQ
ncbi:MAG TPA: signal peptide peptidase SppA [Bacteroidia bacterium]|nr:signal peptide peptidase SppA [Bacteroidia bacterium]